MQHERELTLLMNLVFVSPSRNRPSQQSTDLKADGICNSMTAQIGKSKDKSLGFSLVIINAKNGWLRSKNQREILMPPIGWVCGLAAETPMHCAGPWTAETSVFSCQDASLQHLELCGKLSWIFFANSRQAGSTTVTVADLVHPGHLVASISVIHNDLMIMAKNRCASMQSRLLFGDKQTFKTEFGSKTCLISVIMTLYQGSPAIRPMVQVPFRIQPWSKPDSEIMRDKDSIPDV
jgi:hypothetical protein